jgi:hypothetical protein
MKDGWGMVELSVASIYGRYVNGLGLCPVGRNVVGV